MNITSFLVYCIIATFSPGPTNIVILSAVQNVGAKQAMKYTYGATAGFALLLIMSAVLNTVLITIVPKILIAMQIAGSLYMFYLAYLIVRTDSSKPAKHQTVTFISGFLMQFLNPKVVLFAITVIPSFIMPYYNTISAVTISIIGLTLIGFSAFVTWVLFGTIFRGFLQKHNKAVNVMTALCLVYAALMIWI